VTGPGPVEARVLRGSLLAVVITSMFGLAVTIGAMIFVESESGIEWLSRALGTTLIAFLAGTGGLPRRWSCRKAGSGGWCAPSSCRWA